VTEARARPLVAVLVVALATVVLFWPLVIGALVGAPRFFEWDVPEQYWGDLVYLCRSVHHGELPYWNPYDRGGYPYYADPQAATYHPLAWGICAVAGASPGLGWQELRVVIGFACAGLFAILWLRRLGASWEAASVGAVVVEAAPFMRHNWELNLTSALGWLPMVLWAFERLVQERRARDVAVVALAEALLVWSGSPPAAWLAGSFTALYAIARLVEIGRGEGRQKLLSLAPHLFGATLLTIGLVAVVLVPGLTLSTYSVQAGRSYESLSEGGLTLERALALFWPQDGNHLYVGWVALALTPLAFFRAARLPGRWAFVVLGLIALLLAMGDHAPLFRAAFDYVPGVRLFRLPHRYEAWLGPCVAALAAAGLDAARERLPIETKQRVSLASATGIAAILAVFALAWLWLYPGLAPVALTGGAAVILLASLSSDRAAWPAASVVLTLLMLADVSQRMPTDRHTRLRPAPADGDVADRILAHAEAMGVHFRVMDEFGISCRAGTRLGIRDFRGYQDPLLLHAYERVVAGLAEHPELAMQFNVRYALTSPHFLHGWDHHYLPRPEVLAALPGAVDLGDGVIELPRALPWAYVVPNDRVVTVSTREDALALVTAHAPAPMAVIEGDDVTLDREPTTPLVAATVARFSTDSLAIDVHAPSDGTLVVNDAWYPGWRAWVDGREVPIRRANGFVRAVPVPAGDHAVTMRFEPPDGAPLRWLLVASWLALLVLALPWTRRTAARKDAAS
jgi:hypothetical protein